MQEEKKPACKKLNKMNGGVTQGMCDEVQQG